MRGGEIRYTSARVALFLRAQGYRAWALTGGYQAWRVGGYPIDSKKVEIAMRAEDVCPECGQPWDDHTKTRP